MANASTNDYDEALTALVKETGSTKRGWSLTSGPETGVGVEYYFTHKQHGTYYVCVDQGEVTSLTEISEES
jgi:hypothetical protein